MRKNRKPIRKEITGYPRIGKRDCCYLCSECKNEVGSETLKGSGEWEWYQYKFCPECGTKMDWSGINDSCE